MSFPGRSVALTLAAWVAVAAMGCGEKDANEAPAPAASALRDAVALTDSLLVQPVPDDDVSREFHRIADYPRRLKDSDQKDQAATEFLASWQSRPADIRLLDIAFKFRKSLPEPGIRAVLWEQGVGTDSTSVAARYVAARRSRPAGEKLKSKYAPVEALRDRLSVGEDVFLQRRIVSLERRDLDHDAVIERLLPLIPAAWRVGGSAQLSSLWRMLAEAYLGRGQVDLAHVAVAEAQDCWRRAPDSQGWLPIVYLWGCVLEKLDGGGAAAADSFRVAEALAEAQQNGYILSQSIGRLALLARARGDNRVSLHYQFRSLALTRADGDEPTIVRRLCVVAGTYRALGQLDSARVYLDEANLLAAEAGDDQARLVATGARQLYALQMGDMAQADSLVTALLADEAVRDFPILERDLLLDVLESSLINGRPDLGYFALERLRGMDVFEPQSTDYDPRLWLALRAAELFARQGETSLAGAELDSVGVLVRRPIGALDRWLVEQTRGRIADLLRDPQSAAAQFQAALAVAEALDDPDKIRRSRIRYGQVLLDLGRPAEARRLFASSAEAPERWSRFASALYSGLALAAEGRHEEALETFRRAEDLLDAGAPQGLRGRLELARARSLIALGRKGEAWQLLNSAYRRTEADQAMTRSEVLRAFLREEERDRAELMLGLLLDEPSLSDPGRAVIKALEIDEAVRRPVVPGAATENPIFMEPAPGSLVLRFFLGKSRGFVWTGTASGWTLREVPDLAGLVRRVRDVTADMADPDREITWEDARRLAVELLGDAAERWAEGRPLTVLADGVLHDLPWPALPLPDGSGLLIDRGPILHADGGRIAGVARAPHSGKRLLALGVDGRGQDGDVQLREAAQEARDIASLFPAGTADVLTGAQAAWSAVRVLPLDRYDAVHLATHARLHLGQRGASTLRLSEGGRDLPVTSLELRKLPLDAELVYLSCCEGARHVGDHGSGLDSMARAFLQAGAEHVVASVVPTDDASSRRLAELFYAAWLQGDEPAEALRNAQRGLREGDPRWRHPFWWAFLRVLVDRAGA